jgi:hypothetical protein
MPIRIPTAVNRQGRSTGLGLHGRPMLLPAKHSGRVLTARTSRWKTAHSSMVRVLQRAAPGSPSGKIVWFGVIIPLLTVAAVQPSLRPAL